MRAVSQRACPADAKVIRANTTEAISSIQYRGTEDAFKWFGVLFALIGITLCTLLWAYLYDKKYNVTEKQDVRALRA